MSPLTAVIMGLIAVALVVGGAIAFSAPVLAIVIVVPLMLLGLALWFAILVRARRRDALTHEHVRFTDEDKPTLTPSETPGDVHIVRDGR